MSNSLNKEFQDNWELIKETIRTEFDVTDISYNTWIEPLSFNSLKDNTVIITISSDKAHAINYISKKFHDYFKVTISEIMNHTYDVSFILEKDAKEESFSKPGITYNINYENSNLNAKYRFDTFVVGSNNRFAHSAALAVAESPGVAYNPLYIYGGAGLGKTHLMHSIGHFILENQPTLKVLYVTSEQFTNEVINSIKSGSTDKIASLRDKYRNVDVLMVDDVQFIIGKQSTQEEFFHTFNALHLAGKQVILSSDKPPKEMSELEERFRSRFEWGLIVDIQAPDYETRMAILEKNAENINKNIDKEIFDYIAKNITSNIRDLEGAFNKIIAYSKLNKVDITLEIVKETLKDIISPDVNKKITSGYIINVVAEHYGIQGDDIVSSRRNSEFVLPRQICMYLCRKYTEDSLQNIAKSLKRKDHTTVIHGIDKITEDIKTNQELKNNIDILIKKLNP